MNIPFYSVEIDDEKKNLLVKEKDCYCDSKLNSPEEVVRFLNDSLRLNKKAEEHVYLMTFLNKTTCPVGVFEVSHGLANCSLLNPREILLRVLLSGENQFILAHNHPSGSTDASTDDYDTCNRIAEASKIMGMAMLDFLVIGNGYCSFKEKNII